MIEAKWKDFKKEIILPDWLGSGQDLLGTIQVIRGKKIEIGFLEIDFDFKFSETFNYPIIFQIRSADSNIEAYAISFRFDEGIDPAKKAIDERIIAPKVCNSLRRDDFIRFFAEVGKNDIDFALYINKTPERFKKINVFKLDDEQKIVFNERLILAITDVLDERKI